MREQDIFPEKVSDWIIFLRGIQFENWVVPRAATVTYPEKHVIAFRSRSTSFSFASRMKAFKEGPALPQELFVWDLPLTFLTHFPALRSLTLNRVFFEDPGNHSVALAAACADSPPTHLDHLDLTLDISELNQLSS
jgi:hypothetical protein